MGFTVAPEGGDEAVSGADSLLGGGGGSENFVVLVVGRATIVGSGMGMREVEARGVEDCESC